MRMSVSVPDELWDRACKAYGSDWINISPSALVQEALTAYIYHAYEYEVEALGGYEIAVSFS